MADTTEEQEASNLAHLKKVKNTAKTPMPEDSMLDLPDPVYRPDHLHRTCSAQVKRRNRIFKAEQPPPPATRVGFTSKHRRSNSRRKSNKADGDDRSDSDGYESARVHGENDASAMRRRPEKQLPSDSVQIANASSSSSTSFTPEEQERIRVSRPLNGEPDMWQSASQTYKNNTPEALARKERLVKNEDGSTRTRAAPRRLFDFRISECNVS
ncbi:uncharacterized protein F4807DRAFT_457792 [Annulohypoxylon truncatum]|uniref:uncharacterized protein n=1 Tax=Annulohypoxylon truncatum TaxID=327061 RepID=UPI002008CA1E|nr:uncharacterized protein F4807DRAFT_457792 [Annulohypoxylon truncatum]KAI1212292.1 hypothetical protein F4807DRAFT_457792 [Annulohypoxylon truncatum]